MKKTSCLAAMGLVLLSSPSVPAWEVIDEDGWCCVEGVGFYIVTPSFLNRAPYAFPNFYSVLDQLSLSAMYWNDSGTEFNFYYGGSTTQDYCKSDWSVCMVEHDDEHLDGAAGLTHWSKWPCIYYCWDWTIGIDLYWIIFSDFPGGGNHLWRTQFGSGDVDFYKVATHEFGHALGLDHNDSEYAQIMMKSFSNARAQITEDDSFGATYLYGRNEQRLRFRTARFSTSVGLTDWTSEQHEADEIHETYGQPFIAENVVSGPFDFVVGWTRADNRAVCIETIKMDSVSTHHIVDGPWCYAGYTSWQGPSVGVSVAGRLAIAYRYEKENPNIADPVEMKRNSMVRLLVTNPERTIMYNIEPGTCQSNGVCRTLNTPIISYSIGANRWLLAFTEGPKDDQNVGNMHSLTVLLSDDETGYWWSRPPLRVHDPSNPATFRHSSYLAPGFSCRDPQWAARCLLAYASYDRPDGWMARIYQAGIGIGGTAPSGLYMISGSNFEWGRSGFGHINVTGAASGWLMTRLDTPASPNYLDNLTWSWRHWNIPISGSWNGDGNQMDMVSEKGFSVACKYLWGNVWCRFVWAEY